MMFENSEGVVVCEILDNAIISGPGILKNATSGYLLPVKYTEEEFDPLTHYRGPATTVIHDDFVEFRLTSLPYSKEEVLSNYKSYALDKLSIVRKETEVSGVVVPGLPRISTSREHQTELSNSLERAQTSNSDLWIVNTELGPMTVSKEKLIEICLAMFNHVQNCFTTQRVNSEQVSNCLTVEEVIPYLHG